MSEAMNIDVFISYHFRSSRHIADALVHSLEEKGIRCWYAPRNTISAYAGEIYRAIQTAKVFLVIMNSEASRSVDVLNEINLVMQRIRSRHEVTFMSFRIEDSGELSDDMKYYAGRYHWIDAIDPPTREQINELVCRVMTVLGKNIDKEVNSNRVRSEQRYVLMNNMPKPKEDFVGRRNVLDEIHQRFSDGEDCLFICGMGGIGKSQLVMQYAKEHNADYDMQIYANYTGSLVETISNDKEVPIHGMEKGDSLDEIYYENRKMPQLKKLVNQRTLLVIDNFDVVWDEKLDDLLALSCKKLITSRTDFAESFAGIRLNVIEECNELRSIFENNYKPRKVQQDQWPAVDMLNDYLGRHTMAIAIVAKQCSSSRLTPAEMLEGLKKSSLHDMKLRERISFDLRKPQTGYEIFKTLFSMEKLTNEEKTILCDLALVPNKGINARSFHDLCSLETYDDINSLVQRNWILLNPETDTISLHPLVSEVVMGEMVRELPIDSKFLNSVIKYVPENSGWSDSVQKIEETGEIIKCFVKRFPKVTTETEEIYFCAALKLSNVNGMRKLVINLIEQVAVCRKEKYEKYHERNLEILFHLINYHENLPERREMIIREVNDVIQYLKEKSYFLLAMQFCMFMWNRWHLERDDKYFAYADEAERLSYRLSEDQMTNIRNIRGIYGYNAECLEASINHCLTGVHLARGDVQKAYQTEMRAKEILEQRDVYVRAEIVDIDRHREMNMQSIKSAMGSIHLALGQLEEAEKCFVEKEQILLKYRRSENDAFRRTYCEMIRMYRRMENDKKAMEYRIKLRRLMDANYAVDTQLFLDLNDEFQLDEIVLDD